ncbi:MAG TPA: tetratricopeptide repeat protein [Burkholderiales bacterium]|nr:tetratricopeptide repeat protein [Burkholderiales bacterium]
MSLLMKALQKAAQNRESSGEKTPPAQDASPMTSELALQPLQTEPETPAWKVEPEPPPSPELAATVMRASEVPGGVGDFVKGHPVVLLGVAAALLLIGGAIYVYLAISKPSVFVTSARPPAPPAVAAVPATQVRPEPQPQPTAAPQAQEQKTEQLTAMGPQPVAADVPEKKLEQVVEQRARSATRAPQQTKQAPLAPSGASSQQNITVTPAKATPQVAPQLVSAYQAFQQNRLDAAQDSYQKMLAIDPNNTEALLGLAAVAEQQKQTDKAVQYYLQVLRVDPRNATAQAGLLGIVGHNDPQASEMRLKQLLAREPSGFVFFTLGNLYAEQSQWPGAQSAYMQAFHLQPDNADYAFNLAVSLEHISQPKVALKYYQQALQLAKDQGHANFDLSLAQNRISKLSSLE